MAKQKPSISDLVNTGIIKIGQTFFARNYMGTVVDSENVEIEYCGEDSDPKNMGNRPYPSFSKPAREICGYDVNAWFFWKYFKGEEMEQRAIDDWRKEYRMRFEPNQT